MKPSAHTQNPCSRLVSLRSALVLASFALAAYGFPSLANEAKKSSSSTVDKLLDQRFIAYTSAFADRFKLPAQQPQPTLGDGLQAIEIGFERRHDSDLLQCFISLYVDAKLDIADDLGIESSADVLEVSRHFFLRPRPDGRDPRPLMARKDAENLLQRQARYFIWLRFTTGDYVEGKSGADMSAPLKEHARNLFPGLHYIRTPGCVSVRMIQHGKGVDVGIRRKGAPNLAQRRGPFVEEHFVRVSLPMSLLSDAVPSLAAFEKYIQDAIDARNRQRREAIRGMK